MKKLLFLIILSAVLFASLLIFTTAPQVIHAQGGPGGLVPCAGPDCSTCDLFALVKNVVDFITLRFVPVVATLLFVWGGLLMIIGGANKEMFGQGKKIFTNTVIGVVIVFLAWLIVNFTMKSLAGSADIADKWYDLTCSTSSSIPATGGFFSGLGDDLVVQKVDNRN